MRAVIEEEFRSERLDRLLAGAGHSLRTPLNAVLGFTDTLLMGLPGPLKQLDFLDGEDRREVAGGS